MSLHFYETKQKGFHMDLDLQLSVEAMDHVLKFDDQLGTIYSTYQKCMFLYAKQLPGLVLQRTTVFPSGCMKFICSIYFLPKRACKVILELCNRILQKNVRKHKLTNCCCFVN